MSFTVLDGVVMVSLIAAVLTLMWVVRRFARHYDLSPEVQRKLIHVTIGLSALTYPAIFSGPLPVFVLTGLGIVVMLALRKGAFARNGIGSVLHDVERKSYGEIYLALAIAFIFFRSQGAPVLYVLPILVITLSDTASALVGTAYGKSRFAVANGTKSLEGVVAFFVVTWLCAMIVLLLLTDAGRVNIVVLSLLIAAFCALVEAESWNGLDNLFVPIGAHLLLAEHLDSGALELTSTAVVFIGAMLTMLAFASAIGVTEHAARAYTILLFIVLSVTTTVNVLLLAAAVGALFSANRVRPAEGSNPDLEMVFTASGVALLWLFAGELEGHSVVNLFNFTFAGAAVVFAGLALTGAWRFSVVGLAVLIGLALFGIGQLNMPRAVLFTPPWPVIIVGLAIPVVAVLLWPQWFSSHRALKATSIALLAPIVVFIERIAA